MVRLQPNVSFCAKQKLKSNEQVIPDCYNSLVVELTNSRDADMTSELSDKSVIYRLVKIFSYPPYPVQESDTYYFEFRIR